MSVLKDLKAWSNSTNGKRFLVAEIWTLVVLMQVVIWKIFHMTIFGLAFDAIILAIVALAETLLAWPLLTILKKIAIKALPAQASTIREFGRFPYYAAAIFVLLLGPHLWMSAKMTVLRDEFGRIASHGESNVYSTGEYSDGRPINGMDFGGRLDEVVEVRNLVLAKHQFLPLPIGAWKASTGDIFGPRTYMAYVYTFLPRSVYRDLIAALSVKLNGPSSRKATTAQVRQEIDRDLARIKL